jgi:hypothetical protein
MVFTHGPKKNDPNRIAATVTVHFSITRWILNRKGRPVGRPRYTCSALFVSAGRALADALAVRRLFGVFHVTDRA